VPTAKRPHVGIRTIRRRDDGTIYAQLFWKPTGPDDKGTEALGWTTREAAELAAERKAAALFLGVPLTASPARPSAPSIGLLIGKYADDLDERQVGTDGYRANVENRSAALTRHLGRVVVDELTIRHLNSYVADRRRELGGRRGNRKPRRVTVLDELKLLRRVIDTTRGWGEHKAQFPGMPSFQGWADDARPARKLSDAEHAALVSTAALDRPALARLLTFLGWCPRRPVAVFALRRKDCARALDPKYTGNDLLYFERDKGNKQTGWGPILPEARAVLVEHLRDTIGPPDELVWRSATGQPYTANILAAVLRYLNVKASVADVHPYDLRKLAAVRAYARTGRDLKATCRFTGHESEVTLLKHYLYESEDAVTAAVQGKPTE
jgi:integrase